MPSFLAAFGRRDYLPETGERQKRPEPYGLWGHCERARVLALSARSSGRIFEAHEKRHRTPVHRATDASPRNRTAWPRRGPRGLRNVPGSHHKGGARGARRGCGSLFRRTLCTGRHTRRAAAAANRQPGRSTAPDPSADEWRSPRSQRYTRRSVRRGRGPRRVGSPLTDYLRCGLSNVLHAPPRSEYKCPSSGEHEERLVRLCARDGRGGIPERHVRHMAGMRQVATTCVGCTGSPSEQCAIRKCGWTKPPMCIVSLHTCCFLGCRTAFSPSTHH